MAGAAAFALAACGGGEDSGGGGSNPLPPPPVATGGPVSASIGPAGGHIGGDAAAATAGGAAAKAQVKAQGKAQVQADGIDVNGALVFVQNIAVRVRVAIAEAQYRVMAALQDCPSAANLSQSIAALVQCSGMDGYELEARPWLERTSASACVRLPA